MKKWAFVFLIIFSYQLSVSADVSVYSDNNKFGLKNGSEVITEAKYKKLVKLGEKSWIMQDGVKYGIITNEGRVIIEPKYNKAERVLGKYVEFAKGEKYGIYDEMGFDILPVEYSSIDLLYGGLFVTCKNYKYGITDMNGQVILDNIFDDIYMPDFNTMVFVYGENTFKLERTKGSESISFDLQSIRYNLDDISLSEIISNPVAATGYYGVTATDYIFKLISSISPAYEKTIDELMFSQGADTVNVLKKFSWIPKFPFTYAKKYYNTVAEPYSGPLGKFKKQLKHKVKN